MRCTVMSAAHYSVRTRKTHRPGSIADPFALQQPLSKSGRQLLLCALREPNRELLRKTNCMGRAWLCALRGLDMEFLSMVWVELFASFYVVLQMLWRSSSAWSTLLSAIAVDSLVWFCTVLSDSSNLNRSQSLVLRSCLVRFISASMVNVSCKCIQRVDHVKLPRLFV